MAALLPSTTPFWKRPFYRGKGQIVWIFFLPSVYFSAISHLIFELQWPTVSHFYPLNNVIWTFSLTQNSRDNCFSAMTTNVNQLSVKTFNFPEFQSHKIRGKCSLVKAPLWPNVDILVGCSCHMGGSFTKLHFKVLPYWKLGKNSEKWLKQAKPSLKIGHF